jgi:hypothetical protein
MLKLVWLSEFKDSSKLLLYLLLKANNINEPSGLIISEIIIHENIFLFLYLVNKTTKKIENM